MNRIDSSWDVAINADDDADAVSRPAVGPSHEQAEVIDHVLVLRRLAR